MPGESDTDNEHSKGLLRVAEEASIVGEQVSRGSLDRPLADELIGNVGETIMSHITEQAKDE